jgi:hypothetical protein
MKQELYLKVLEIIKKFSSVLNFVLLVFACVWIFFLLKENKLRLDVQDKAKLEQAYTIKVLDAQGKSIEIYQGKTFEFQSNRLYVCPKGTEYCSQYVKAIVINSNYIIEPEN